MSTSTWIALPMLAALTACATAIPTGGTGLLGYGTSSAASYVDSRRASSLQAQLDEGS